MQEPCCEARLPLLVPHRPSEVGHREADMGRGVAGGRFLAHNVPPEEDGRARVPGHNGRGSVVHGRARRREGHRPGVLRLLLFRQDELRHPGVGGGRRGPQAPDLPLGEAHLRAASPGPVNRHLHGEQAARPYRREDHDALRPHPRPEEA